MRGIAERPRRSLVAIPLTLWALVLPIAAASSASPDAYSIRKIGPRDGLATGVNDRGQVIGSVLGLTASDPPDFLWTAGRIERIPGRVQAINANGAVIGVNPRKHAFLWRRGRMTDLGTLGGWRSFATAINAHGHVVGWSVTGGPSVVHAFLYRNGRMRDLGKLLAPRWVSEASDINSRGQVVGSARPPTTQSFHAFLWHGGKAIDLGTLGGKESAAVAINDRGQIIGTSATRDGDSHAFLWQRGKMTDLGTLGGADSFATAINSRGQVVGSSTTKRFAEHAFFWQQGGMADLGSASVTLSDEPDSVAINDRGQVVVTDILKASLWERGTKTALPGLRGAGSAGAAAINNRGLIVGWSGDAAVVWTRKR